MFSAPFSSVDDIFKAQDLTEPHSEMDDSDLKQRYFSLEAVDPT